MALLPILEFPDPRLRTKAVPVDAAEVVSPAFQTLLDDMFQTMYEAPGIGLAASQVDVHKRFMVIDVSEEKDAPQVFINPEIVTRQGEQVYQEGCLSVPGIFADVSRADAITVRYLDRQGAGPGTEHRWPAGGVHPARNGPSGRQAVRGLSVAAQARDGPQETGQTAQACGVRAGIGDL